MSKQKIILDTDPGVDDAICLALTCAYDDLLELLAVTTIGGNNYTSVTTQNALNLLAFFNKPDIPVYYGEDQYLKRPFDPPVAQFHGANGLADYQLPTSTKVKGELKASEAIYQLCKANPKEVIVVTVGPMTNLAKALLDHPDLGSLIKKVVVMGGGINCGNITPYAEANVGHDAEAADIVFSSGLPVDMIGLNTTRQCPLPLAYFEELAKTMRLDIADFIKALIIFRKGEPMHDAIAMATLIDDSFVQWQTGQISIELTDELRKGETICIADKEGHHRASTIADPEAFLKIFQRVGSYYHS